MANNVKFSTGLEEDLLKLNSDRSYVHKIDNGHVYFATRVDDEGKVIGSIYYDINGERISMGGAGIGGGLDDMDNNIADTYVTRISSEGAKYASTDGVTITTYNGRNAALGTITLPVASADRAGVIITGAQTFAGNKTFSGIVHLSNTRDADGTADSGVLIIGDKNGEHLILDGNEIIAKNTTSKTGTLYLNNSGGLVQVGGALSPSGNKTLDFGSATNYWKNGYIANLVTDTLSGHLTGTLTGNVTGNVTGHASLDLPLAGGTMTGDIAFATIATWPTASGETYPIKSKGLKWAGSSDNAAIYYQVDGSDSGHLYLDTGDDTSASVKFSNKGVAHTVMTGDGKFHPVTNNSGSIGTSSNKFAAVYATNFYGIIEKAYADESGNNIKASYAASLKNHAHDGSGWSFRLLNKNGGALTDALTIPGATTTAAGLVTTGEQTFAGKKTFNGQVVIANTTDAVKGTANSGSLIVGTASGSHIVIDPDEIMAKSNGTSSGILHLQYEGGNIVTGGNFNPKATNSLSLGTQDLAWKEAHIGELYGHLNGSVTGTLSGNASSASKWLTARTLTIGSTGKKVDGSADVSWSRAEIGISKSFSAFKTASTKTDGWYTIATISDSSTSPALFFVRAYAHSSMIFTVTKGYDTNGGINILDFNNSRNDGYAYVLGARLLKDGKVQIKIHTKTSAGANTSVSIHVNAVNASDTLTLSSELVADDGSPAVIQTREPANATAIMMANTFYGNLSGTASHATNDASGAAILTKYLTRLAFAQANNSDSDTTKKLNLQVYEGNNALKATIQVPNASTTEAGVVNTGTQTFAGNKTFSGRIHFSNTTDAAKGSDSGVITIGNKSGEHMLIDQNEIMVKANATTSAVLHLQAEGGQTEIGGAFIPKSNKAHNLGGESNYWKNAYISNVVTDTLSGHLTGSLTGPVTGNVTGNLTGNVTGNVTGHASEDLALKDLNTYVVTKSYLDSCADYERSVIALCETTATNTACSSHWKGSIYRTRDNGLVPQYVAEVAFQGAYSGASQAVYSLFSNFENTSTAAVTGEGYRPCIFTYNGKTYAGVEFAQTQAAHFYITGNGNFKPFLVKYYNSNTKAVLNADVNGSLKFGSNVGIRQEYYLVGTATKAISDESSNNIKASYGASLQAHTHDGSGWSFRLLNKNAGALSTLTIPAASDTKAGLMTINAQTFTGHKTFKNDITIQHATVATMTNTSANPFLKFLNSDGSQGAMLMFTDYDSYRAPGGLKLLGIGSVPAWFEVEGDLIVGGATTLNGNLTLKGNLLPSADNTYTLGSNDYKWKEMHATTGYINSTLYVNRSANGASGGIGLYSTSAPTDYGIAMRNNLGQHGYATDGWNTYFSMVGGAARGWIFRNGGTAIASINGQGKMTLDHSLQSPSVGKQNYIAYPKDGVYVTSANEHKGYLKITLPQSWTSTMMRFKVSVYNYSTGTSVEYLIGGYNYSGGSTWEHQAFAQCIGKWEHPSLSNLTVRFGHDGTKCAIYIGESSTVWNYPQVVISDIVVGYSNYEHSKWCEGWVPSFTTTLGTITKTISNTNIAYRAYHADRATADESGSNIKANYLARIRQVTSDKDTFTFRGVNKNGADMNDLITVPSATAAGDDTTTWRAGLVTSQAQTWAGTKTFKGDIHISHAASATMDRTTTNPRVIFSENGTQPVGLVYTDYDGYRSPAGLKVMNMSDNGLAWFEVEGALIVGSTSTLNGNVTVKGNIMPQADNTYVIGDLNAKWKDIYSTTSHVYQTLYVNTSTTGSVGGIALHGTVDPTTYGIAMRSNLGAHAYATDTWNTYFSMSNGATRGWVFRNGTTNVASINGQGYAQFNKLSLNRVGGAANGRISWYSPTYYTWYDYMSNSAAGAAPTGGQPSQMGSVTSWAKRSLIESVANYGWIWESASNAAASATTTQPTPRMALAADTGRLYLSNDLMIMMGDTDKFVHYLYANGAGATNYVGASWRAGVLGSGSSNTNYYVIQSGTSSTANTTWENAVRIGQNNYDFTVGTTSKGGIGVANTSSTTGNGISLYNGAMPNSDGTAKSGKPTYGLFFGGTGTFGKHGGVQGDWATYFTMDSTANRGWVFLKGDTAVASISNSGITKLGDGSGATASSAGSDTGALRVVGGISTTKNSYFHEKITFPENKISLELSSRDSWKSGFVYDTNGHEAFVLAMQNNRTSFIVAEGTDPNAWASGTWVNKTPIIQAKKGALYINKLLNGDPAYNLHVEGTANITSNTSIGGTLDVTGTTKVKQGAAATAINTGALQVTGGLSTTAASYMRGGITVDSGNITFPTDNIIQWSRNTDLAKIGFKNDSDGDADSYLYFHTADNGNEHFKFRVQSGSTITDILTLKNASATFNGTVTATTFSGTFSGNASSATAVKDRQTGTLTYLNYGASGITTTSWFAAWNGYELRAMAPKYVHNVVTHAHKTTVDLSSLDNGYWYPVTGTGLPSFGYNKIKVSVHLNSGTKPSWSTHASGFTVNLELYTTASGWGTTSSETIVLNDAYSHCSVRPAGYSQNGFNSTPVLWLRGGGKYFVETDFEVTWTVRTSTYYTYGSASDTYKQTVAPTTSDPGIQGVNGKIMAGQVWGAVWNDYAEYRKAEVIEAGRVVVEDLSGEMKLSTKRLQPGANIISDTFGFAIGETSDCKTPIAVSGRVLAYTYEDRNSYPLGAAVCTGPNGTVSLMTREEIREYPERIIGTVSEIPNYETWGSGNAKVNGRIWIKVK